MISVYFILTCYYMWYLPLSTDNMIIICASIGITNLSNFAIFYQFANALLFVCSRFNMINCLLEQLLYDVPFNDRFLVDVPNTNEQQPTLVSVQPVSNIHTLNQVLNGIEGRTGNILYMQSSTKRATKFGFRQLYELMAKT